MVNLIVKCSSCSGKEDVDCMRARFGGLLRLASDAAADPMGLIGVFPLGLHPPILYPLALAASARGTRASKAPGFTVLSQGRS
jgi:hypothetical protein